MLRACCHSGEAFPALYIRSPISHATIPHHCNSNWSYYPCLACGVHFLCSIRLQTNSVFVGQNAHPRGLLGSVKILFFSFRHRCSCRHLTSNSAHFLALGTTNEQAKEAVSSRCLRSWGLVRNVMFLIREFLLIEFSPRSVCMAGIIRLVFIKKLVWSDITCTISKLA